MTARRWVLWRQDDNGNRAVVESFDDEAAAHRRRRQYEARGHKQLYCVEGKRDQN